LGSDTESKTNYITIVSPDAPDLNGRLKAFHLYEFGVRIALTIRIENAGKQKAGSFQTALYLSNDGVTKGELLGKTALGSLRAGYVKDMTFGYTAETPLFGKYLIVSVDSDDQVLETDETNNQITVRIP
jgi:subtilase family serine protease